MKIIVIDGQGGRIGKMIVESILDLTSKHELIAIGTNSIATSAMIKAGATKAATGENPVLVNAKDADIIIGPIGIIIANALLGEVTEKMALAIANSPAKKILIPISKCHQVVVGVEEMPLANYIDLAYQEIKKGLSSL